jgi:pimeloyl-ACP methyl ester carboxylesterase
LNNLLYNYNESTRKVKSLRKVKKILFGVLTVFVLALTAQNAYCQTIKKEIQIQTKDNRVIKATVSYVKIDKLKQYPTVVLLHSLGYSSENWGNLIELLNNAGYAVIAIDFRGHGKSIYDGSLKRKTWVYFTPKAYLKFPSDVEAILTQAQKDCKIISLKNYAIVGADIGANTAVLVANDLKTKPKTLVLISPTTTFKGLYIPIAMAQIGQVPILTMASQKDLFSLQEQKSLSKFAQGGYYARNYPLGGMGMLMIQSNPTMTVDITKWLLKYCH